MTNEPHEDELARRLAGALSGLPVDPRALGQINTGFRRRRNLRWTGAATAVATAGIVTFAVVATCGGNDRQTILPPITQTTAPAPVPTETPSSPPPTSVAPPPEGELFAGLGLSNQGIKSAPYGGDIVIYRIVGTSPTVVRTIAPPDGTTYESPIVDPSGRYVYFTAQSASRTSLMKLSIDSGELTDIQVSLPGGLQFFPNYGGPVASADGSRIAFSVYHPGAARTLVSTVAYSFVDGTLRVLADNETPAGWLPDGKTLVTYTSFGVSVPSRSFALKKYDMITGQSTSLASLAPPDQCDVYAAAAVSPQGEIAAATSLDHNQSGVDCPSARPTKIMYVGPSGNRMAGPDISDRSLSTSLVPLGSGDFMTLGLDTDCGPLRFSRINRTSSTSISFEAPLGAC